MLVFWFLWGLVAAHAGDGRGNELDICRYNAVLFAAQDYRTLPDLETPFNDVQRIAEVLQSTYGFEPRTIVENPTRLDILRTLHALRSLGACDALVVYYAGHGYVDPDNEAGFWQLVDADPEVPGTWVANDDVRRELMAVRARHVLLVSDSCFSGSFFRGGGADPSPGASLGRLASNRSRWVITSGGLERVADTFPANDSNMSPFAYFFHQALSQAEHRHVLATEIFSHVLRGVNANAPQVPVQGPLLQAGHEDGYLVLARPEKPAQATVVGTLPMHNDGNTEQGLQEPVVITETMLSMFMVGILALLGVGAYQLVRRTSPQAGDGDREPPAQPQRHEGQPEREVQPLEPAPAPPTGSIEPVAKLLMRLFSPSELRRFVAFNYPGIVTEILDRGSLADLAFAVVERLQGRGTLNWDFFQKVQAERPRRTDVAQVAQDFLG